jgi:hypothetical protein
MDEQFVKRRLQLPRYRLSFRPPAAVALCEKNPERECCDLIKQIAQGRAKSNENPACAGVEIYGASESCRIRPAECLF